MLRSEGSLILRCLAVAVYSQFVYDYYYFTVRVYINACTSWQMVHAQCNTFDLHCAPALLGFVFVCRTAVCVLELYNYGHR
jgi:hypothetical protein